MNLGQKQRRKQLETMSFFYRNINRVQYHLDSIDSIERPLPRREIDLGYMKLEVFALPGFEKERGRYLLSQTSAAIAIAQDEISARRYFSAINPLTFKVEGSKRPIRHLRKMLTLFSNWLSICDRQLQTLTCLNAKIRF